MRSFTAFSIVLIALICLLPAGVWSQTHERFAMQGVLEVGGSLSYQYITPVNDGKTGTWSSYMNLAPSFGIFVIDGFEAGLNPLGVSLISRSGTTDTDLDFMGFISYNLTTSARVIYPFIEGQAGYTSQITGTTRSGFSWAGRAGVKVGVVKGGLLTLGVMYSQIALSPEGATERTGQDILSVATGFSVWF